MALLAFLPQKTMIIKVALAGALFTTLTVAKAYPLIRHFGTQFPGDLGDPLLVTWILGWSSHALTTDPLNLFNANIFYPVQNTLALSEHMIAVVPIFAPVYLLTGNPILAYNTVFFLSFILCGMATFLLVHHWTEHFWASLVSGCLFALAPIRFAEVSHLQLSNFYWTPLAFLFLEKFMRRKGWRDLAWFAICYWLQVLSSVYLGWFVTIALGTYILYYAICFDRSLLSRAMIPRYAAFILSSLIILLPFHLPYYIAKRQWGLSTLLQECIFWSADPLLSYLSPHPVINDAYRSLVQSHFPLLYYPKNQMMLFPGLVISILMAIGIIPGATLLQAGNALRLKRLFGIVLIVSFLFSLGPFLVIFGKNTGIPLPYLLFYYLAPGFQAMRVPARFALMAILAASVLAALGFLKTSHFLRARLGVKQVSAPVFQGLLALVWIGLFICELGFKPLPLVSVSAARQVPEVYRWLATGPLNGPIVELPLGQDFWVTLKYMYFSTYHWLPLVNGSSRFIPPTQLQLNSEIAALPSREAAELLSTLGVRGVVLHADQLEQYQAYRWQHADLAESGLEEMARFGSDVVYRLAPVEAGRQLHVELAVPDQLPAGEMIQLPAGAMIKARLLAESTGHRHWTHPLPLGRTQAMIKWKELQTGKMLIQQENLQLPLVIRAEEVWSAILPVSTPSSPGGYTLGLLLPSLGLEVAPKPVQIIPSSSLTRTSTAQLLSAAYVLEEPSSQAITSGVVNITLLVMNTGRAVWLANAKDDRGAVRLGWRWFRGKEEIPFREGREPLQYDVFPGQAYRFRTMIKAPLEPGDYSLELGLVNELVTWFSDQGIPPLQLDVRVQRKVDVRVQSPASPASP